MLHLLLAAGLTVTAVGDVRITPRLLEDHGAEMGRLQLKGDVVIGNFEGVLSEGAADGDPWKFCMPGGAVDGLSRLGLTVLGLANNHSMDMGAEAYRRTAAVLGGRFAVAGREGQEAVRVAGGQRVRVIGFGFGTRNDVNRLDAIPGAIGRKRREIVIVSAHMGGENHTSHQVPYAMEFFGKEQRGDVVAFSHRAIDAGADLVLGHGPHVPRGIELYKGKLIVYSLGNFLFDYPGATLNAHAPGYSISVKLDERGDFVSARIVSYDLKGGVPVVDGAEQAYRIIRYLTLHNLRERQLDFPGKGKVEKCAR